MPCFDAKVPDPDEETPVNRNDSAPWPEAENVRRGEWARRLARHRVASLVAFVAAFVLAGVLFSAAEHFWDARNDNAAIASASHRPSGDLVVSGKGVTLTFPAGQGWLNVPVTPNQLARFVKAQEKRLPWLASEVSQSQQSLIQLARTEAMLVYRVRAGTLIASCDITIVTGSEPLAQLAAVLRAHYAALPNLHARVSMLTFGGRAGVLMTYDIAEGQTTDYEAAAYVPGGQETPIVTVTTLSPASSLATLRQLLPTLTFN
jgi:hypothetical protein